MLIENNLTIQKCIKYKVKSECLPPRSLKGSFFRITTVNTLEHILPDPFPSTFIFTYMFAFVFFKTWNTQGILPWNLLACFFFMREYTISF